MQSSLKLPGMDSRGSPRNQPPSPEAWTESGECRKERERSSCGVRFALLRGGSESFVSCRPRPAPSEVRGKCPSGPFFAEAVEPRRTGVARRGARRAAHAARSCQRGRRKRAGSLRNGGCSRWGAVSFCLRPGLRGAVPPSVHCRRLKTEKLEMLCFAVEAGSWTGRRQ